MHIHSYFQPHLTKSIMVNSQQANPIEMNSLGSIHDLDHTPFRSLRPRSQIGPPRGGGGVTSPKNQGPVVCSVAPNLPARPPSSSDTDSIRKNHWDYEGTTRRQNVKYTAANVWLFI